MGDPADSARVLFLLDLFGVQSIVTDRSLISPVPGIQGASGGGYVVVERPTQPLVDVVDYPLKFSGGPLDDRSWQALVRQWFRSGEQILVVDGPPFVAPERGSATLASSDNHFNSLSISVEAEAPTSVLIRMGHSRKWRAWTQDGQLPVHRVTPNNMLVVADEDFELHFQPLDGRNWAGLLISVLSVCGYGFLLRRETA